MALLSIKNLGIQFGGLRAVDEFNLEIEKGELYGLIGPNGAGKTTVFNMLTGVYKPTAGEIVLDGKNITGKKQIEINKLGVARTFQNIRLFSQLSVLDNVKAGLHNQYKYSTFSGILVSSLPSNKMLPDFAGTRPVIVWRMVVLPAPLAPISAITSPWFTSKEMPLIARITP